MSPDLHTNMIGTDVARFTHKQSRSYLNHLVSTGTLQPAMGYAANGKQFDPELDDTPQFLEGGGKKRLRPMTIVRKRSLTQSCVII